MLRHCGNAPNARPDRRQDASRLSAALPDFAAAVATALGRPVAADIQLAVAVSGGSDSLALLLLAARAFPGRVTALTVDHGLRAAAAVEAAGVAEQCAALGVPHVTLCWEGDKPRGNIQAAARTARYRLMGDWCAGHGVALLVTAHHADDQAETLLMRLQRGSGSAGLAGIRAARPLGAGVTLVRPLLGVRRAALAALVAAAGWQAVDDPSNADRRFDRTVARAFLAQTPAFDVPRLAAIAANLAAAEAALDWATERAWAGAGAGAAEFEANRIALDVAGLPDELVRRLVLRAIVSLNPVANPAGPQLAALQARLAAGGIGTLAGVKARGGAVWVFNCATPRRKTA
jgi:tRNA(Ile)-lysidine synthase